MKKILLALCSAALCGLATTHAQLAITEVMSSASTNLGSALVPQNSDFWELSNLGT
ncbi:MAG: hypothetical protein JWM16_1159, partial [Verrucomicrobiales bacterium]|nr:hypothetical protein [Verrucomicrobiales bacterium]